MIHTAKQLKDKVKNLSDGRSEVAQSLIRYYFMERFLERLRQPFKIDISTDDVITPDAIELNISLCLRIEQFWFCPIIWKHFLQKKCRQFLREDWLIRE